MNIYELVANNSPNEAIAVAKKYGYDVINAGDPMGVANILQELVAREGEPALRDVASLHPDKDVLVELFGSSKWADQPMDKKCSCSKKSGNSTAAETYIAAAQNMQHGSSQTQQGNLVLIGMLLVVTLGILVIAKN